MIEPSKRNFIDYLTYSDFKFSSKSYRESSIVLFIDDTGETKILKNRNLINLLLSYMELNFEEKGIIIRYFK